eukprot:5637779-Heterocapsa_arctica.AAC.1
MSKGAEEAQNREDRELWLGTGGKSFHGWSLELLPFMSGFWTKQVIEVEQLFIPDLQPLKFQFRRQCCQRLPRAFAEV